MIWLRFYVIDTELFRLDGDWVLLWRIKDFASKGVVVQNAGNSGVGFMVSQLAHAMGREVISWPVKVPSRRKSGKL